MAARHYYRRDGSGEPPASCSMDSDRIVADILSRGGAGRSSRGI